VSDLPELERFTNFEPDAFDAVSLTWLGHMPQVDAAAVEGLSLPFGIISTLSFNGWLDLEGLGAWDWESYYGARQTFVGGSLQAERSSKDVPPRALVAMGGRGATLFWLLAVTTFDTFLVHPNLSCGYASYRRKDGRLRVMRARGFGELECLRLPLRLSLRPEHVPALQHNAPMIDAVYDSELASVIDALGTVYSRTLSPSSLHEPWLDFVGQLELFLNPAGDSPLGKTFSDRFAVLCAQDASELPAYRKIGKAIYDFRSDTLHGRDTDPEKFARAAGPHYPFPSTIVRRCIELLVHLGDPRRTLPGLSPEAFLRGDRAGLTDAYVAARPDRLQTLALPAAGPDAGHEPDPVDAEASLPPVFGPDAKERLEAFLSSMGARPKADD
jgi:hypothetical protein